MQLSYWEHQRFFNQIDICIVGSGIVGLCTALELKQKAPNLNILILERSFLPYGASTRNAGFACFGSVTELEDDLSKISENEVINLVERRFKGLQKLKKIIPEKALGLESFGGYELFKEKEEFERAAAKIEHFNRLLKPIIGPDVYKIANDKIEHFGFKGLQGLIYNQYEAQVDTGLFLANLLEKVRNAGIQILNGIEVEEIKENEIKIKDSFSFEAKKIIIATNGFAAQFLPDLDVHPARAQVLVTKPIPGLQLKGTFHYERGYYYFRNIGNEQVLFGGGRNLDFAAEKTVEMNQTELIQNKLEELLREMIIPQHKFEVERRWSGIMGVGENRVPIIKEVQKNIYCAVRMGGMGVALGSLVGEETANLVLA